MPLVGWLMLRAISRGKEVTVKAGLGSPSLDRQIDASDQTGTIWGEFERSRFSRWQFRSILMRKLMRLSLASFSLSGTTGYRWLHRSLGSGGTCWTEERWALDFTADCVIIIMVISERSLKMSIDGTVKWYDSMRDLRWKSNDFRLWHPQEASFSLNFKL